MAWLTLLPEDIELADRVAVRRQEAAEQRGRKGHNGAASTGKNALALHVLGARTELAGKFYFHPKCHWNDFRDKIYRLPDLEDWIDVKGVDKFGYRLIVQKNDPPEWAYLLIVAQRHPIYDVIGWCWGHEAQQKRFWDDPQRTDRPAYYVGHREDFIKAPHLLYDELRRRQNGAR